MYLRTIYLTAEKFRDVDEQMRYNINVNSNFLTFYVTKAVRRLKSLTDGTFNGINIEPTLGEDQFFAHLPTYDNLVFAYVHITREELKRYLATTQDNLIERYEFYLMLLERGFRIVSKYKEIPLDELQRILDDFRAGGYKNEWTFKRFRLKDLGLSVYLNCYYGTFDFRLYFEVYDYKGKEQRTKLLLLHTEPFELAFWYIFRKASIEEGKVVIRNFLGDVFLTIDCLHLAEGTVNVEYCKYSCEEIEYTPRIKGIFW